MINFKFEEVPTTEKHLLSNHYFGKKQGKKEFIKDLLSIDTSSQKFKGGIGDSKKGVSYNSDIRDVDICKINFIGYERIYRSLIKLTSSVNKELFGFNIDALEEVCILTYENNGHYITHIDTSHEKIKCRKLTFLMGLSDKDSYEGGIFYIFPDTRSQVKYKLDAGDILIFPTYIPHKVDPVTSGTRKTIVTWFWGEKFK